MMRIYKCIKTLEMRPVDLEPVEVAFTEGKVYEGRTSATPLAEWVIEFIDDMDCPHLISGQYLREHFELLEEVEASEE